MLRFLCACTWAFLWSAQAVRADDAVARQHFEAGVEASEASRWEDAVQSFEVSLSERDRPATRFNLILAHEQLKHPLEVVRHALAFLAQESVPGREDARERATMLLNQAKREVASLSTVALPADSRLEVDGNPPSVVRAGRVYLLPGVHHLELLLVGGARETNDVALSAGQELSWPRSDVGTPSPVASTTERSKVPPRHQAAQTADLRAGEVSLARFRLRAAWVAGPVGAGLALAAGACLLISDQRGDRLAKDDIEGARRPGYFGRLNRYWSSVDAIMPLALAGGVLMASAVLLGPRFVPRGSFSTSIASIFAGIAALGFGIYWLAREPARLISTTDIDRPSREAGSLLLSAALPLLAYGITFPLVRREKARVGLGLAAARIAW